jgi:predicted DNA-binding transcriptional regulator AlpA
MHPDILLKTIEVREILRVSHATLYRRIADGTIPKPIKLGSASRWQRSDILAAIEAAKNGGAK